ncbi:MAG TPA: hypothetical protein PK478_02065 [Nitrospira sp.]|nr:hypothetical protein [Nitrospira sp.]
MDTISPFEVLWALIVTWGAWHHAHAWRDIHDDVMRLEAGELAVTPGAMALYRNDADSEADWALVWLAMALVGLIAMTQPRVPTDIQGVSTTVLLFGVAVWARFRSEVRGRRRARVIAGYGDDEA